MKICPGKNYLYEKSIIFVLSGEKRGYLNDKTLIYNQENILLMSTDLAFECEGFVSDSQSLQGVLIQLDIALIQELLAKVDQDNIVQVRHVDHGATTLPFSHEIKDALGRLLKALGDEFQTRFLADGIIREILYYVLQNPESSVLSAYANYDSHFNRVYRSIRDVYENLNTPQRVGDLAK